MKLPLVYIHSANHSGSTLLALQLARHPQIGTVGELSGTVYRARPGYKCSCGLELRQCGFWKDIESAMARRGFSYSPTTAQTDIRNASNPYARRLLKPLHRGPLLESMRDAGLLLVPGCRAHIRDHQRLTTALVESVIERCGEPVLVDSSKSGVQLKYHLRNPKLNVKVIWLVRDGRGVALSIVRNKRSSMPQAAYEWRRTNEEAEAVVGPLDPSRWIQVRYEDLCSQPDRTLSRLWQFIGVSPTALNGTAAPEYHVLGHRSRLNGLASIRLDEKWRTELSPEELRIFDSVAGPLNRRLGYH